ncbi:GNAT family N-acetyltransferase [Streptomyces mangrovisoli]|uniref:GNAT family N-acetyltransferase n=1 Tax=Streptomyces mangrovisoli TaxID=1428628 RepID=A0A1J4NYJ5_9ACTN|nr:GNAT family N-acetyltransferase [Streptomyces mangrovisoli]OIJ67130.1 GNAT family N-acetyltransferase [Streptomyces mangrovisoli]
MSSHHATEGYPEKYLVRPIRAEEWPAVRGLRLDALRDPVAHLAFLETYDQALAKPDSFWRERAEGAAEGAYGARQFIAESPDGEWAGTVTVLLEEGGSTDWAGFDIERTQGHVVGVFVRPEHRGSGLIGALFDAAVAWSWEAGAERVRLIVHEDNARAQAAYRRLGFRPSGVVVPLVEGSDDEELEFVLERD